MRAKKLFGDPIMKLFEEDGKNAGISNHLLTQSTSQVIKELMEETQTHKIN